MKRWHVTSEEEKAIELKRDIVAGQERSIWNPARLPSPEGFEFAEIELARIKTALETWASYSVNIDRRWLEPLLDAIVKPEPKL